MAGYDYRSIENKWQKQWSDGKIYEPDVEKNKPHFFITVAWPYPSGAMHVGHARTYTVPDVIARFMRMKGYNVLFPMGYHLTGSPIIGAVERIRNNDVGYIKLLKEVYGVKEEDFSDMLDPVSFARYFTNKSELGYRKGMTALGYSIAWSRECTSIDPHFSKMIEWQYRKLYSMGLIIQGSHPVKFCPHDNNPVTDHDLLEGEDAEITEFTLIKYDLEGKKLPAATLRPETTCGITNIWLHPYENYVEAQVDNEVWIVSKSAVDRLSFQGKNIRVIREFHGSELIGKKVKNPFNGDMVLILPATFVDVDHTSGVVGSVPGHAPYDYMALIDLQKNDKFLDEFKLDKDKVRSIAPVKIINLPGYDYPAVDICRESSIKSQDDKEKLDIATKEIYRKEHVNGKMIDSINVIGGMKVSDAKEKAREYLLSIGEADTLYEFSKKPVICRCGTQCVVKLVENQWFIKYSDEDWKVKVRKHFKTMKLIPQETINYYLHTVDWLKEWPCTRNVGLGTRLPWDKKWIIESLSDSTIYMTYYTMAHLIKKIDSEKLDDDFFDYVFWKKGNVEKLSSRYGVEPEYLRSIQDSVHYWHPQDFRVSANELIPNHLTFFVFHHLAVLPEDMWPSGIATFGMGILEGAKMASSKGNIFPVSRAVETYGADVTRFYLMYMAEPWQDFDWRGVQAEAVKKQLNRFYQLFIEILGMQSTETDAHMDAWLESKMKIHVNKANDALELFQTRLALQHAFYLSMQDIRWYMKRGGGNREVLLNAMNKMVRMLAPFIPHMAEEMWSIMGGKGFVSLAEYPKKNNDISHYDIRIEDYLVSVMDDIGNIKKIVKGEITGIDIIVCPEWKNELVKIIADSGMDMKKTAEKIRKTPLKDMKGVFKEAGKMINNMKKTGPEEIEWLQKDLDEYSVLSSAVNFLSESTGYPVRIFRSSETNHPKASRSMPKKPSIIFKTSDS